MKRVNVRLCALLAVTFVACVAGQARTTVFSVGAKDMGNTRIESPTLNVQAIDSVMPIPEPTTIVLFGTGVLALLGHRRRRAGK